MSNVIEFKPYPKTPRLFREIIVTEKIDGTNAAVQITKATGDYNIALENVPDRAMTVITPGAAPDFEDSHVCYVVAQSRKRIVTPGKTTDNYGFAAWVETNAEALVQTLGEGIHYGEWYGDGIQGNPYGLKPFEKRFALFNTHRWGGIDFAAMGLFDVHAVPVLYQGPFNQPLIESIVNHLKTFGSTIDDNDEKFRKAEGVCVYHTASGQVYKVLCEADELPKTLGDAA